MQTPVKALQLILFTLEGNESRTLLEDSLSFHPDYRVGDIIHILHPANPGLLADDDHQYVVHRVKHIITTGVSGADSSVYILLVEVMELLSPERDELDIQPDHLAAKLNAMPGVGKGE